MKKRILFLSTITIVGLVIVWACNKETMQDIPTNKKTEIELKSEATAKVIKLSTGSTKAAPGDSYGISYKIGHTASDCGNACQTTSTGEKYHAECQGSGTACTSSAIIVPYAPYRKNDAYRFTELYENSLTTDDIFEFPSRSFQIIGLENESGKSWLNIPSQTLQRNPETKKFVFNNAFFSDVPEFLNE